MEAEKPRIAEASAFENLPFREDESEFNARTPFSALEKRIAGEHRVRLHYHENLEINIFSRCRGAAVVNGSAYDAARHRALVLPPRSPHSYELSAVSGRVLVLHLSFEALGPYLDAERILGRPLDARHIAVSDPAYEALEAPCRALFAAETGAIAEIVYRASQILAALDKAGPPGFIAGAAGCAPGPAREERLLELIAFTEKSCASRIRLDDAARVAGLSRGRFCRWFKACAGLTYFAYLEAVRLDRAKLLLETGAGVTEACFEAGFGNLSYFIKRFRLREGRSPGVYIRALRHEAL